LNLKHEPQAITVVERSFELLPELVNPELQYREIEVFEARPTAGMSLFGGIILAQEIFGVTSDIRALAREYATRGYLVWAPSFFDHVEKDVQLRPEPRSYVKGRELVGKIKWEQPLADARAAAQSMRAQLYDDSAESPQGAVRKPVSVVGFCWGGSLAWLVANRLKGDIDRAVSFYGRQALEMNDLEPQIPLIMHFGKNDPHIPLEGVSAFQALHPRIPVYLYEAGHGFRRPGSEDFSSSASELADERSFDFIKKAERFPLPPQS
jgi:carboxymethylenebutenolidase